MVKATVTAKIRRKNFCGMYGETEYFVVSDPRVGLVPIADCRGVEVGDVVDFHYTQIGNGWRWMMR